MYTTSYNHGGLFDESSEMEWYIIISNAEDNTDFQTASPREAFMAIEKSIKTDKILPFKITSPSLFELHVFF